MWRVDRRPGTRRFRRALAVALVGALAVVSCGGGDPADTPTVVLAEGQAGDQRWRLEGRRLRGEPCTFLVLVGVDRPPIDRCGVRRTPLRHLDPAAVNVGQRRLVFSPLPGAARRVRIDTVDETIRMEPARTAPGFPGRFFVVELGLQDGLVAVRVFAERGRAIVT
jgi:hypothetical protein